jgi:hypothetical protein
MNLNSQTPITNTNFQNFIANNKNNNMPMRVPDDISNNINKFLDKDKDQSNYIDQFKNKKIGSNFIDDMSNNIKPISFINNPVDLLNEGYHQLNPNMPHNHGFLRENSIKKKIKEQNNNSLKTNKTQINTNTINNNSELRSLGLYDNNLEKDINKGIIPQKMITIFLNNNNNNNFNSTSKFGVSNVYPISSHNSGNFDAIGYSDNVNKVANELNNKNMQYGNSNNNEHVSRLNSFTSNQTRSTTNNSINTNVKPSITNTSSYRPSSADSKSRTGLNNTTSTNPNNIVINNQFSTTVNNNINNIYIQQTPEELRRIIAISSDKQAKEGLNNNNSGLNKGNLMGNSNSNSHLTATFGKNNQFSNNTDISNVNLIRPGNLNENNNRITLFKIIFLL